MKVRMLVMLVLCLPGWAAAQNDEQMQRMMEQAREAQQCMEKVDRGALEAMIDKAQAMEAKIKNLCAAGKRDDAQSTGMKYGLEISSDPAAKEMRRCSEMMASAMAGFGGIGESGLGLPSVEEMENQHICDAY